MDVTLIGAGNLATSLAVALVKRGHRVVQIYSRTLASAKSLALLTGTKAYTCQLGDINRDSDIYIVAITDEALSAMAIRLSEINPRALWVHTAGSMPIGVWTTERSGVFYPMQTFSKSRIVDFTSIPIFIEANNETDLLRLQELASSLSQSVYVLSSEQRQYLHLAAVFCCNFANHCATLAADILQQQGVPFNVMLPLMDETLKKLHQIPPHLAQTGPAVRGDANVMRKHVNLLRQQNPALADLYETLSQSIQNFNSFNV